MRRLVLSVPDRLHGRIHRAAAREGISVSDWARTWLEGPAEPPGPPCGLQGAQPLPWTIRRPLEVWPHHLGGTPVIPLGEVVPASARTWTDEDGSWISWPSGRVTYRVPAEILWAACRKFHFERRISI